MDPERITLVLKMAVLAVEELAARPGAVTFEELCLQYGRQLGLTRDEVREVTQMTVTQIARRICAGDALTVRRLVPVLPHL